MPSGYWKLVEIAEQRRIENERMKDQPPPVGNDAIFAHIIIAFGTLMLIAAYVTGVFDVPTQ
jgi:hypothetical protein